MRSERLALEAMVEASEASSSEADSSSNEQTLATAALVAVAMLWGTNFPAVRYLVSPGVGLSAASYAVARFGLAAAVLSPLLSRATSRAALLAGLECGVWIALGYGVQCLALESTTAAKGALFAAMQVAVVPVVVALFPTLRSGAEPSDASKRVEWACAAAAVVGVALFELGGLTPPVLGDAAAALQPVFFGVSYLRIASAAARHPSDDDALAMSAAQTATVAALSTAWFASQQGLEGLARLVATVSGDQTIIAVLVWTALASTALTILLQTYALKRVSAAKASIIVSSEPLFAAILAAVLLGECDYGPLDALGALLILSASVAPSFIKTPDQDDVHPGLKDF